MSIDVYICEIEDGSYDVDVYETNGERDEELTKTDMALNHAEEYVKSLMRNKKYTVHYKGTA